MPGVPNQTSGMQCKAISQQGVSHGIVDGSTAMASQHGAVAHITYISKCAMPHVAGPQPSNPSSWNPGVDGLPTWQHRTTDIGWNRATMGGARLVRTVGPGRHLEADIPGLGRHLEVDWRDVWSSRPGSVSWARVKRGNTVLYCAPHPEFPN